MRFRQHIAAAAAAVTALVGSLAIGGQSWWLAPVLLLPLGALWWALWTGVDVDRTGLRIRGMVASRTVTWSEVAGFVTGRGRVDVLLTDGNRIRLPAVTAAALPRLFAAGGRTVEDVSASPPPAGPSGAATA